MIIKLSRFLVITLLCCFASAESKATDTLRYLDQAKVDVLQFAEVFATQQELTPLEVVQKFRNNEGRKGKSSAGFTANIFWVLCVAKNTTGAVQEKIVEIDNPQIDWLYVYAFDSTGNMEELAETGDKFLFSKRPLLHRNFAIPIQFQSGETKVILIKIDKRNSSLNFPIYLWDAKTFHEKTYSENLWFGVFFGIIVLCLAYALMAFIFLRTALYGWYFSLVLVSGLYLFTAHGFSFAYLYPNVVDFNSYFRVYLIVSLFLCMSQFSERFLSIPKYQPLIHKMIMGILIFLGFLALTSIFALELMTQNGLWIIPIINSLMLLGGFLMLYGAIRTFKKQPVTVMIYFAAWGSLIASYLIMTASEFGIIPVEKFAVNPVLIGSSLETFIFSMGLTYQVRNVYNERNQLSLRIAKQQKDLLKAYVEGTEKERERISRELHDDIGSRLGSLKRFITKGEVHDQTLEQQIDILCKDVRSMSHQLAPPSMRITGLRQLVQQLIEELPEREVIQIDVQFYDIPENLSVETTHHLFRIVQEAVNNVVKHAEATELDLQFFVHDNELVMTIEDNGKGFDTQSRNPGIGLQNIRARTESLNGTLEISSQPGRGTNMMIKIPVDVVVS